MLSPPPPPSPNILIVTLTLKVPEKLQVYGLYVYYVVHICDVGMLRVKWIPTLMDEQCINDNTAQIAHISNLKNKKRWAIDHWHLRPKKNLLCCPHPTKSENWVGRSIFFFFFFTYRERVEFSNIFFKVSKWGKLGRNAVKTHIQVLF